MGLLIIVNLSLFRVVDLLELWLPSSVMMVMLCFIAKKECAWILGSGLVKRPAHLAWVNTFPAFDVYGQLIESGL